MKRILVPTDFSDCAGYALDTAVKVSQKYGAELHVYHRANLNPEFDESSPKAQYEYTESFAMLQYIKKQFALIRKKYGDMVPRIITTYSTGDFVKTVSDYVDAEEIDLIVMGSSGASGFKELVMGSQTQKVVRYAHCPVLVVKHPLENMVFKNIVFASDFSEMAKKPFAKLIEFARKFGSHVHMLNVAAYPRFTITDQDYERMKEFEKLSWNVPCTIHGRGDLDLELGVTHFATETQADLVSIAHFGKEPLKRIFTGSLTENLVNHLEIPVLTINTRELKTWKEIKDPADEPPLSWSKVTK